MPAQDASAFSDQLSKEQNQKTLQLLRELGGGKVTEESGIKYHDGKEILLPRGMTKKQAAKHLHAAAVNEEEIHAFSKIFKYRPYDGAYALQETLRELWGVSGTGKTIHTFFGSQPPEYREIEIGVDETVRVPWGAIDFTPMEGTFYTGFETDPTYGALFQVTLNCPKKYAEEVEGLWIAVADTLKERSIYKGKAIVGVGRQTREGFENPSFIDPFKIDPAKVAYKQEVFDQLQSGCWGVMANADLIRARGGKVGKKLLVYGPYGTGKTLAGGLTARRAVENGWTYIQAKSGDEDLGKVLKTAELYAPAVVFYEDIDILAENEPDKMAKLLEMFDGLSSKGKEVMVLMTSNKVDVLNRGMSRPGRIDRLIEIGDLDRIGVERLIRALFPAEDLADDINFDELVEAMDGYAPAFIMGTFEAVIDNAVIRTGSTTFKLETIDFVTAARSYRPQFDLHMNAADKPETESLRKVLKSLLQEAHDDTLEERRVNLRSGDIEVKLPS